MTKDDIMTLANQTAGQHWMDEAHIQRLAVALIAAEREACSRVRSGAPRTLAPVGRGVLLDEQQYCFDKGWKEGAAAVRKAIRARGNK